MPAPRGPRWPFWAALAVGGVGLFALYQWSQPAPPQPGKLYVADPFDDRVIVLDLATGHVKTVLPVGRLPHQLAVGPDHALYVAESGSQSVSMIDTRTDKVVRQRQVGRAPRNPAHDKLGPAVVAAAPSCKTCHRMRVVGSLPAGIALGRDGQDLWVTETRARRVSRLAPGDLAPRDQVALLGGDFTPSQVLVHPRTGGLFVVSRSYKGDVPTGPTGPNLQISADPEHAAGVGGTTVTAFDATLGRQEARLELPFAGGYAGAFTPDGRELYVTCRGADRVAVLATRPLRFLRAFPTAPGPAGIALADPETLVVASFNTSPGVVQFLDRRSGERRQLLQVPANPAAIAVHPRTGQIYVGCAGAQAVIELDPRTRTMTRQLAVAARASGLAVAE